ncbi:MAG: carboxypeptidase regulatory-like domain-containing protein, partial [Pyrinomonadaceae bacterium]|nr:carboxypeptidase regulatory-like domain-containing protein [Pyrinomonadaceae bacterium]
MKKFLKIFALALIFVFVGSSNISAQSFKSTILGRVTDTTGANIPGATVTVTQLGTNSAQTVTTNGTGDYIIPQLPPGDYTLRVEAPNFKATVNDSITLETDQSARFDI